MARQLSPRTAFRRRLMLLMGAFALAGAGMAVQMARLGIVRAEESLAQAEERLYRQRWIPTVRGRVLDRRGRVLAQNRPSYEVAVDYGVLSGAWAAEQADAHARRVHARAWPLLTAEQREGVVARFLPLYEAHVAAMELRLQQTLGIDAATYADRKAQIITRVEQTVEDVSRIRLKLFRKEQLDRGKALTPELEALLQERAAAPIAAQDEPHVLGDIRDEAAFTLIRMLDTPAEVRAVGESEALPGEPARNTAQIVLLLPGVVVRRSEERQYPFDQMQVTLPRDSFPTAIREAQPMTLDLEGVAAHVLGWMGGLPLEMDTDRRAEQLGADADLRGRAMVDTRAHTNKPNLVDRGRYRPGDPVARAGVEWSQEASLRGLRGLRTERLDTGAREIIEPELGRDVHLTLDINLQARVQGILDPRFGLAVVLPYHGDELELPVGTALHGAAVVLDVDSGDVLALVTSPSFSRQTLRERPEDLFTDKLNQPLVNRAIAAPYPPGSIIKALTLTGAVTDGAYQLGERIACTGHLLPGRPDILRCWIYRDRYAMTNHSARFGHDLDGVDAITASCNIFFYTMGRRLGPRGIAQVLGDFGVGHRWELGVGAEFPGTIGGTTEVTIPECNADGTPKLDADGHPEMKIEEVYLNDGSTLTEFDATLMGMGQGPIAWTPLHAANAYATLARMGVSIRPRVVNDGRPAGVHETRFDRRGIVAALAGLDGVVNNAEQGTAHHLTLETGREPIFSTPGVHVWGKTGTAQTTPLYSDNPPLDEAGAPIPSRSGDHAWVTVLVGREGDRPRFAISVIVEFGGSGGRVSGPIVNQIIRALLDEGYL